MDTDIFRRLMMGILSGNPQEEPMHYGEVFGVWNYLLNAKGALARYETLLNHTGDHDLRGFIQDLIKHVVRPEIEQTEELLKHNGIALPPAPPERPEASVESIPPGARVNDPEVAAQISMDIAGGLVACSTVMGQAVREDIGLMFGQFHLRKAQYGATLLRLNKEKGWLVPPPLHVKTPELAHA